MYLCYLDESGTPELGSQTSHFVLVGMAIPAAAWWEKERRIDLIKARYGLKHAEIHTGYMARRFPEQEKIPDFEKFDQAARRLATERQRETELIRTAALKRPEQLKGLKKLYRKSSDYIHLTFQERSAVLAELATEIGTWQDAQMFGVAMRKQTLPRPAASDEIYARAFRGIIETFQEFLVASQPAQGSAILGLLIGDNNQTIAKRITQEVRQLHESKVLLGGHRIIETPLFVDSSLTSMVQMADLCAYATRRFFENDETGLFDKFFSRFDLRGQGLARLYHFTGKESCSCKVCQVVKAPLW